MSELETAIQQVIMQHMDRLGWALDALMKHQPEGSVTYLDLGPFLDYCEGSMIDEARSLIKHSGD